VPADKVLLRKNKKRANYRRENSALLALPTVRFAKPEPADVVRLSAENRIDRCSASYRLK
jgi:hypothetical protein